MNLDDTQKKKIVEWIEQGLQLPDIQSKLEQEFGLKLTYMEARFLLDDLELTPKDVETPKDNKSEDASDASKDTAQEEGAAPGMGGVRVKVDEIAHPGAVFSGKVTFSDGNKAEWHLDQMGRLALAPEITGYKPPESDITAFQDELKKALSGLGI
ncbi:MAG: hypothetical protein K9N48_00245 [Verrucomicrobia bacterium]|nr:hypothetical protein [Verrucomicrobiota bacterium]